MILLNLGLNQYVLLIALTFFLIVLDVIGTAVNSKLYAEYFKLETLPWNRFLYKRYKMVVALVLSMIVNVSLMVILFILPIRVGFFPVFFGFWVYRAWHTYLRLWYWRRRT